MQQIMPMGTVMQLKKIAVIKVKMKQAGHFKHSPSPKGKHGQQQLGSVIPQHVRTWQILKTRQAI